MPAKNIVKTYIKNGYYHIYNRGVEKRQIFIDNQDCATFTYYLKLYLSPVDEIKQQADLHMRFRRFINLNLSSEIDLLAFALMPNHIHLQIKQHTTDGVVKLMRRMLTSYSMYFNRKYQRVGTLFQNRYKATLIETESYLIHLSRYIHLNPINISNPSINFVDFSSYHYYLGMKKASWIKPQEILSYFHNAQRKDLKDILSYQSFVEDYSQESAELLGELILEDEP